MKFPKVAIETIEEYLRSLDKHVIEDGGKVLRGGGLVQIKELSRNESQFAWICKIACTDEYADALQGIKVKTPTGIRFIPYTAIELAIQARYICRWHERELDEIIDGRELEFHTQGTKIDDIKYFSNEHHKETLAVTRWQGLLENLLVTHNIQESALDSYLFMIRRNHPINQNPNGRGEILKKYKTCKLKNWGTMRKSVCRDDPDNHLLESFYSDRYPS